ncbi:uncharacterized protein J3D65DRAFT_632353 [Phyllosticta citribraziliensis]|uniref:Uncharacterized protein n=1 Tax=Phyllosticta citribraziliensis TaxID=989973 RepID=A0ABR1LFU9_9PEZI
MLGPSRRGSFLFLGRGPSPAHLLRRTSRRRKDQRTPRPPILMFLASYPESAFPSFGAPCETLHRGRPPKSQLLSAPCPFSCGFIRDTHQHWSAQSRRIPALVSGKLSPHFSSRPASSTSRSTAPQNDQKDHIMVSARSTAPAFRAKNKSRCSSARQLNPPVTCFQRAEEAGYGRHQKKSDLATPEFQSLLLCGFVCAPKSPPHGLTDSCLVTCGHDSGTPDQQHAPPSRVPWIVIPICHLRNVNRRKKFKQTPALVLSLLAPPVMTPVGSVKIQTSRSLVSCRSARRDEQKNLGIQSYGGDHVRPNLRHA